MEFDMRTPQTWASAHCGCGLVMLAMLLAVLGCCLARRPRHCRHVCAGCWLVLHAMEALACAAYARSGEAGLALTSGAFALSDLALGLVLFLDEARFAAVSGACGLLVLGAVAAHYAHLGAVDRTFGRYLGLENRGVYEGLGLLLVCASARLSRLASRRRADAAAADSLRAYESCWARVIRGEASRSVLWQLDDFAAALAAALPADPRQRGRGGEQCPGAGSGFAFRRASSASSRRSSLGSAQNSSPCDATAVGFAGLCFQR